MSATDSFDLSSRPLRGAEKKIFMQGIGGNIFATKILQERGLEILLQCVRPFGKRMCLCILHGSRRDVRHTPGTWWGTLTTPRN